MTALMLWLAAAAVFSLGYLVGCAYTLHRVQRVMNPHLDALHAAVAQFVETRNIATPQHVQRAVDGLPKYMQN